MSLSKNKIEFCNVCNKNKFDVTTKKLGSKFYSICPDCIEELKLTTKCLELGTDWIIEKHPTKYAKFSNIAVSPLDTI